MKIGKQSTLNDLSDLQADLEAKIEDVKNIKLIESDPTGTVDINGGNLMDARPNGIYHVRTAQVGNDLDLDGETDQQRNGMGLFMSTGANYEVMFFTQWMGESFVVTKLNGVARKSAKLLSTNNTITDANGFIKAA